MLQALCVYVNVLLLVLTTEVVGDNLPLIGEESAASEETGVSSQLTVSTSSSSNWVSSFLDFAKVSAVSTVT